MTTLASWVTPLNITASVTLDAHLSWMDMDRRTIDHAWACYSSTTPAVTEIFISKLIQSIFCQNFHVHRADLCWIKVSCIYTRSVQSVKLAILPNSPPAKNWACLVVFFFFRLKWAGHCSSTNFLKCTHSTGRPVFEIVCSKRFNTLSSPAELPSILLGFSKYSFHREPWDSLYRPKSDYFNSNKAHIFSQLVFTILMTFSDRSWAKFSTKVLKED